MRALIIDDSRAYRMVLKKLLDQLGFDTVEAESGFDGMLALKKTPDVQLITVDQIMPKMSGIQFVRLIREKPEFSKTPVLMISVEDQIERHQEALEAGVNEYLVKPVTKDMIEQKLIWMGITLPKTGESAGPEAKK